MAKRLKDSIPARRHVMNRYDEAMQAMAERFGHETLISLATVDGNRPFVRTVNGYYENGAFYVITWAYSNKMKHIAVNPEVAVFHTDEWFTAHGVGENLGHVQDERNEAIMLNVREAFASWYGKDHFDVNDPNTCLLRIRLTDGALLYTEYKQIDFVRQTA